MQVLISYFPMSDNIYEALKNQTWHIADIYEMLILSFLFEIILC